MCQISMWCNHVHNQFYQAETSQDYVVRLLINDIPWDVIKWKHFLRYWPYVQGIHQSLVNSPHKGQWRGALMFSLICTWFNSWVNNRQAGDLRCRHAHYDVTVMNNCICDLMIMPLLWLLSWLIHKKCDMYITGLMKAIKIYSSPGLDTKVTLESSKSDPL